MKSTLPRFFFLLWGDLLNNHTQTNTKEITKRFNGISFGSTKDGDGVGWSGVGGGTPLWLKVLASNWYKIN